MSRIGVLAAAAVGAVVTATFIVRSSVLGSRTTAPAATIAPAQPAATPVVASRPPAVASSETTGEPKWRRTRQSPWATDGSRIIGFEVEAERDVRVYMDRVRPVLAVRCTPRAIEVFVFLGSSPSVENGRDTHAVRIALDHEPDVEQHWLESSDMQALFAPEGKAFAARIATASHLRFAFTPFNAPPTMAEFDVHGFDKPLATMSKTCAAAPRRGPSPRG